MAAPAGNHNAARAKRWREAILRALARATGDIDKGLDAAADKVVTLALEGDRWALEQIADRVDGKATQGIQMQDENGAPVGIAVNYGRLSGDQVPSEALAPIRTQ